MPSTLDVGRDNRRLSRGLASAGLREPARDHVAVVQPGTVSLDTQPLAKLIRDIVLGDGLTYYVNGQVIGPGPAEPESGSWTCSGDQASVTFIKADGPNTWDIQRDTP
jgi:hypothetical protein